MLRGNLRKYERIIHNEVSLGGSPTINVTLFMEPLFKVDETEHPFSAPN